MPLNVKKGNLAITLLLGLLVHSGSAIADVVLTGKRSAVAEASFGNLMADAVRSLAGADIAFVPASVLKPIDIEFGGTKSDKPLEAIVDKDEPVSVMMLTGRQVRDALERSVSLVPKPHAGFLQVSGVTLRFDPSQPPGKRLGDVMMGRQAISDTQTFKVAMPKSLATGGMGYFRVWGDTKPQEATPGSLKDALTKLTSNPIDPAVFKTDTRIRKI